ncbi:DUF4132 domain-containing protein [Glycomyces algeriensis]|uniref:DUF4132 domain-containing protein n=1 Tax=Glycomyces algeriensis TaxID=256037 RepID=A0A9W6LHQ1_9ACTN|nr:DUF4132 domain-containing protein [Glycomyces algeriensis]MDA1364326.1 DUF4132 domain-containing protein [Glycomyces algeriensis]MDR7350359.1 hypothetical protein [Glycomyces algeriensis]GLI43064.1 hypothetical protein GALLR39Z86_29140 [Glycomyces algeriensis]
MTAHAAPQADQLELPAAWAAKLLPRRGKRSGKPAAPDPDAPGMLAEQFELHAGLLADILHMKKNRRYKESIHAFIGGAPDSRGAAAVGELLRYVGPHTADWWSLLEFRAWHQAHGLPWAVATAIERYAVQIHGWHTDGVRPPLGHLSLTTASWYEFRTVNRDLDNGVIAEIRATLAAATDDEYAAVIAAAAEHRDHPAKRFAATLLLPDETDWTAEICAEYQQYRSSGATDRVLLHSVSDPAHLEAAEVTELDAYTLGVEPIAALVDSIGAASLPILRNTLDSRWYLNAEGKKQLLRAIAMLPGDEAAAFLVARLDQPFVFDAAVETARRYPASLLRAVAAAAGAASPAERGRLAAVAAGAGPLDGAAAEVRDAIGTLTDSLRTVPDAVPTDLPPLLTAPPWTVKRRKVKPPVLDLEPIGEPTVDQDGDDRWREAREHYQSDTEQVAKWRRLVRDRAWSAVDYRVGTIAAYGPDDLAEPMLAAWSDPADRSYPGYSEAIVARFGTAAIEGALNVAKRWQVEDLPVSVFSVEAARFVAERYARRKTERAAAAAWFERHGRSAATALVPDALGADRDRRKYAEAALFHLARRLGDTAVLAAAEPYGPEAVAGVTALFGADPLEPRGVKIPRPGPWAVPAMFPQVLLKGGDRALPADSVRHLITVLALATPDYAYPGLDTVAETCDRASLARFGRAVFEQWLAVGAPAKDQWALTQLAHFAEDETVWQLAPRLREWPGDGQHKRAVAGLGVLGAIGTEEALRAIQATAEKVKFPALREEADVQIARVASELGLSRDQLADRLVPDFGLGDEGARVIDYGPRKFTVGFDEQLKPHLVDEDGKVRKSLPKPGVKDDAVIAEDAYQRFQALRKELKTVAAEQVARLETAMVTGRTWEPGEFRRFHVEHALTGLLARRLVWLCVHDGVATAFRIAEDGTFSDADDDAFDLPEGAAVRLAHPALLGDRVGTWAEILADYEILQPFDQLSRPVAAFTAEELASGRLARFAGATVATGRVLGLGKRGWRRAYPGVGGLVPGFAYVLGSGCFLILEVEPGIPIGHAAEHPQQTLKSVYFADFERFGADPVPPKAPVDPVAAAEALGALARLAGSWTPEGTP